MTIELADLFASNMRDVQYFVTIELIHSAFRDAEGNPTSWRFVQGFDPLDATLEADAPVDPGETVRFEPIAFDLALPTENTDGRSELQLTIDGASGELVRQLDLQANAPRERVRMVLREYISTDLSEPEPSIFHYTILDPSCTAVQVSARAVFNDPVNTAHPSINYTRASHPGLSV